MRLRPARPRDEKLLGRFLLEAAFWRPGAVQPPLGRALEDPKFARYVEDYRRTGDFGVIAERERDPVGAAWCRCFRATSPAYGFVDEATPELSIAVLPEARGQGIGTAMLAALGHAALAQGVARISLSVERDNRAAALYERSGFRILGEFDGALTMVCELAAERAAGADAGATADPISAR
jgi:GNAT superfamily N-acetyltransferase